MGPRTRGTFGSIVKNPDISISQLCRELRNESEESYQYTPPCRHRMCNTDDGHRHYQPGRIHKRLGQPQGFSGYDKIIDFWLGGFPILRSPEEASIVLDTSL